MTDLRKTKNFNITDEFVGNVTDNFNADYKVGNERKDMIHNHVKLIDENQNINKMEPNGENSTGSTTYAEQTVTIKDVPNTTVTEYINTSPVTNDNNRG